MAAPTTQQRTMQRPVVPQRPKAREWPWPLNLYQSAVGRKWLMAITGIALIGFVVVHMIGNFKVYFGAESMYVYAEGLRDIGEPFVPRTHLLWLLRFGLVAAFGLHILCAYTLQDRSRRASGRSSYVGGINKYEADHDYQAANYASRTMQWTGTIVLLYLLFHLADLTWGWFNPDFVRGDAYNNLVASLERWPVSIIYIVANVALAMHLYHGAWSLFQSLGINNPRYNSLRRAFASGLAFAILVGNISFPIAVLTGLVDRADPTYLDEAARLLGTVL